MREKFLMMQKYYRNLETKFITSVSIKVFSSNYFRISIIRFSFIQSVKFSSIVHPPIHSSIHLSIFNLFIHPFIHPSFYLSSIYSSIHSFIHPSIYLQSIHPSIYSFIYLLIHLSIHLSIYRPITPRIYL